MDFVKYDPPRNALLSAYGLVQFVVLIGANSHFLALLPKQAAVLNVAYFIYILATLVCLGGVLENRRGFQIAEAARLTATALVVTTSGAWFGGVRDPRLVAAVAAFQDGSPGRSRVKWAGRSAENRVDEVWYSRSALFESPATTWPNDSSLPSLARTIESKRKKREEYFCRQFGFFGDRIRNPFAI
ncbi:MAG: hypothetical protein ABSH50_14645 [Bryobacteraceae bacterium]